MLLLSRLEPEAWSLEPVVAVFVVPGAYCKKTEPLFGAPRLRKKSAGRGKEDENLAGRRGLCRWVTPLARSDI